MKLHTFIKLIFVGCLMLSNTLNAQTQLRDTNLVENGVLNKKTEIVQLNFTMMTRLVSVEIVSQEKNKTVIKLPHTTLLMKQHRMTMPHLSNGRYSLKWRARGQDRFYVSGIINFEYKN